VALGTQVRFVALVLTVSRSEVSSGYMYTSIEPSQRSLLLWVVEALNGVSLLRSQIGTAFSTQGPVSHKPRKLFGPAKPFLDHLYLKTENCIRLKLLVSRETPFIFRI